jgi:hypothetical protein
MNSGVTAGIEPESAFTQTRYRSTLYEFRVSVVRKLSGNERHKLARPVIN